MNWINVKDKFPPIYDFVLVCADNKGTNEPKPFSIAKWDHHRWDFVNHCAPMPNYGAYMDMEYNMDSEDVTHWMALPEVPNDEIIQLNKMLQENYDNMVNSMWRPTPQKTI